MLLHRMPLPGSAITGLSDELCALCSVFCGLYRHVLPAEACTFVTLITIRISVSKTTKQQPFLDLNTICKVFGQRELSSSHIALWLAQPLQQGTSARSSGISCEIHLPQARNMRLNIVSCCECRLCIDSAQSCAMAACSVSGSVFETMIVRRLQSCSDCNCTFA